MNPRHFSQHRATHADGPDDPLHLEPLDLSTVDPANYPDHEGQPVMLTPELLAYVSDPHGDYQKTNAGENCDLVEYRLEQHYHLDGSGWGITWDTRDQTARLIQL